MVGETSMFLSLNHSMIVYNSVIYLTWGLEGGLGARKVLSPGALWYDWDWVGQEQAVGLAWLFKTKDTRLPLDWLRVDRKSGIFPFLFPIGFRWSKLPLFVRKERIKDVFVECAAICLYLHLAKSVHSSPFVIEFLLDVLPPTPNWFIDSGFWARINWKTQTPVLSPVTTLFPLMTSPHSKSSSFVEPFRRDRTAATKRAFLAGRLAHQIRKCFAKSVA